MVTEEHLLRRELDQVRSDLIARIVLTERGQAVFTVQLNSIESDLQSIKATLLWLVRLIVGAVIVGLMTYILQGGISIG